MQGSFLRDVEQWPGQKCGFGGPLFPCQLTHGTVVSFGMQREALAMEHLFVQGWHVYPTGTDFMTPLLPCLLGLKPNQIKHLSGNGWCLPAVASWMVYVWSNTVRRQVVKVPSEITTLQRSSSSERGEDEGTATQT